MEITLSLFVLNCSNVDRLMSSFAMYAEINFNFDLVFLSIFIAFFLGCTIAH